jgi:uncharacterized RDD family membrane protein YckC
MPLTLQDVIGWLVVPAAVFAAAYQPILTRLSLGMISPYAKADVRKRLYAALLDAFIVVSIGAASVTTGNVLYVGLAAFYALFRDALNGHSAGKLILGLVVLNIETGRPASWKDAARRNLLFLLPGANVAAVVLETRTLRRDPQGQRLGDRFAHTQVVEGASVAELIKEVEESLNALLGHARPGRGRTHQPIRDDRAA